MSSKNLQIRNSMVDFLDKECHSSVEKSCQWTFVS